MSDPMFDDETLMAYADGELDAATTARIDALLAADDSLKARIAMFARTRRAASEALGPIATEQVPEALARAVKAMVDRDAQSRASNVLAFKQPQKKQGRLNRASWLLAAAATVLLFVAGSGGYLIGSIGMLPARDDDFAAIRDPAIIRALSEVPSGKPVELAATGRKLESILSFKLEDGTFCREFRVQEPDAKGVVSIACLEQNRWQTHLLMAATRPEEGYVPAGSVETIDAYLASIHASSPLEGPEEEQLLHAIQNVGS